MQLSVWERESFFEPQDIIIVGSGLVGLWSALELKTKHPSLKIAILERGIIPTGASTRNAGFACFGSPSELLHDTELYGEDRMWQIVEMRHKGIEKIRKHFSNDVIAFDECGGYEVFDSNYTTDNEFKNKIEWLNTGLQKITGVPSCFQWANNKLDAFGFSGFGSMIENKLEGCLHSGKLVKQLMQKVVASGVQIFTNVEVKGWEKVNGNIIINPNEPINFWARQLLLCTNAFTNELLPQLCISPARGQILLTSPIENLKLKGAFHYDEGYYYFRNLGNRVLLGGARNAAFDDEETTAMQTSPIIQQQLQKFLSQHILPGIPYTIEQKWSGIMGFTADKQAIVKRIDDTVAVAVCCNGMGVALAPVIAENICEMML